MTERNISVFPLLRPLINSISPKVEPAKLSATDILHEADNYLSRALEHPEMMDRYLRIGKQKLMQAIALIEKDFK